MNAQDTNELFFREVRVPVGDRIGAEGEGFALLMQQLPFERLLIAIGAVATMERAIGETIAYTKQRTAFGKPLFELQNTRFTLAECHAAWRVSRSFLDDCIELMARAALDVPTAAMAKFWSTEQQSCVIDNVCSCTGGTATSSTTRSLACSRMRGWAGSTAVRTRY